MMLQDQGIFYGSGLEEKLKAGVWSTKPRLVFKSTNRTISPLRQLLMHI